MIKLERDRSRVPERFSGSKLEELSLKLLLSKRNLLNGEVDKIKFNSGYWRTAKDQLLDETNDKCAYCETPTKVVAHGDVEHYRPKSIYWWLAYTTENYLASCAICNQSFKSNHFPILSNRWIYNKVRKNTSDSRLSELAKDLVPDPNNDFAVEEYLDAHDEEETVLLNPYIDDPADYFAWRADTLLREVALVPIPGSGISKICVEGAETYFGLNRKRLKALRYETFESYLTHKLTLLDTSISPNTKKINEQKVERMCSSNASHSGIICFFESLGHPENWMRSRFLIVDGDPI